MKESFWFYAYRPMASFAVSDEDAAEFLQSQFSNELQPFKAGRATYGLWLDVKGKVLGDSVVLCHGESRFHVLSESSDGEAIRAHLERHVIADDVEIEPAEGEPVFELSAGACAKLELNLPEAGWFIETEYGYLSHAPESSYLLMAESNAKAGALRMRLADLDCRELSASARGLLRIASGRPLIPLEIGAADLPGEGGLERDAVSFTKGCFLGQEVVARMHNLGQARRRLFVVTGEGEAPDLPLPVYNEHSKAVGEVRSAYEQGEGWRGVALLKSRFVGAGETLRGENSEIAVCEPLRKGV
ncbi:MAG: hypothetical protein GVY36_10610 [Verrucomicrobia bacterium]|jgi:folate-binding protein YgfZ|nr:hypothetical protein [Verrucomicrobiota bacterium]